MTKIQLQYLADRLIMLGESIKEHAWNEIRKGFHGISDDYANGVWISEQARIFKCGLELKIPSEWTNRYKTIIEELKEFDKNVST